MRSGVFLVGMLLAACGHTTERSHVDFERMRLQQRYDLYGASSVFANRSNMQAPPVGTVSRETVGDTGAIGTGVVNGSAVADIPLTLTADQRADGVKSYRIYCAVCHGPAGYGGSIVAENMGPPRPPSLRSARLVAVPVGYIFGIATHGLGRMPSYASQLSTTERWAVVAYVKRLQATPTAARDAIEDSVRAFALLHSDSILAARKTP
jgi:mono/diheme cytochrome c family protein